MRSRNGKKRLKAFLIVGAVLACLAVSDYWLYPTWVKPGGRVVNLGENGLWLRYTWYFGQSSQADLSALAARLKGEGVRDAYFHVRSIEADGTLKYHFPDRAVALNQSLKELAPGVRRIAWIYAGNEQGLGSIDISNPVIRRHMAEEAAWLCRKCGFDGVQWDYEICPDGDRNLLALLQETRAAMPPGAFLGVAAPIHYPPPFGGFGWSEAYFALIAAACDQVAVMAYDTGAYSPRLYVWLVAYQVRRITRAVARSGSGCKVVLGLPTYGPSGPSHNPRAENLRLGLIGARDGLAEGADLTAWQGWRCSPTTRPMALSGKRCTTFGPPMIRRRPEPSRILHR